MVDHHQHLFRGSAQQAGALPPADAQALLALLDEARIRRAVVLSVAYQSTNPNRPLPQDPYASTRAENDWTGQQVAASGGRLIGFFSVNPLVSHALPEIQRCTREQLWPGLKLHFGNSDVQLDVPDHRARLRDVFAAADDLNLAIAVHLRSSVSMRRAYGAAQARAFIEDVLPSARKAPIQIAHLGGAGGYDEPTTDEVLAVFCEAMHSHDSRVSRVYFDVSGVARIGDWRTHGQRIVSRLRQLGTDRLLYGSDGAVPGHTPEHAWAAFCELPLTPAEIAAVAHNVAPYLRGSDSSAFSSVISALPAPAGEYCSRT
jgi:predicted TIM-barrel fold metal-dependent hydrolase